jgi:hypothetical protein
MFPTALDEALGHMLLQMHFLRCVLSRRRGPATSQKTGYACLVPPPPTAYRAGGLEEAFRLP